MSEKEDWRVWRKSCRPAGKGRKKKAVLWEEKGRCISHWSKILQLQIIANNCKLQKIGAVTANNGITTTCKVCHNCFCCCFGGRGAGLLAFFILFLFFSLVSIRCYTLGNSVLLFLTVKKDRWQYHHGCKNVGITLQYQTKSLPGLVPGGFLG